MGHLHWSIMFFFKNKKGELDSLVKVILWIVFFILASWGIYSLLNGLVGK